MSSKKELREKMLSIRRHLLPERRQAAKEGALRALYLHLKPFSRVLSFASKEEEIDLWPLNKRLAEEGRLLLPRLVDQTKLLPFTVTNPEQQLVIHSKWNFFEPHPDHCPAVSPDQIDCILVPGVAFDKNKHRLGYGKGCYDRFLVKLSCPFYGVGFQEQLLKEPPTSEPHDIPLSAVYLF